MTNVTFKLVDGSEKSVLQQQTGAKLLSMAAKAKIPIRFGCSSCRCGTCAVRISHAEALQPMMDDEKALLSRMGLDSTSGKIRLSCRSRLSGQSDLVVDLTFQDEYSPDRHDDSGDGFTGGNISGNGSEDSGQ